MTRTQPEAESLSRLAKGHSRVAKRSGLDLARKRRAFNPDPVGQKLSIKATQQRGLAYRLACAGFEYEIATMLREIFL